MNIGGLDIGTTGCKLTVYQTDGTHLCTAYRAYDEMPDYAAKKTDPGLLHAGIIYEAVGEVIWETVKKTTVDAIGVTSFGETFVLLDADDRILLPSILYADARGVEECAVFAGRHTEQITGVAPGYLFSLPKIMWVKKHHPEAYEKAKRILLMQDFVVYMLTGTAQIDYSLATRTMGFDIRKKRWSKTMFDLAGVEMEKMSKPVPSGTVAGKSDQFGLSGAVIVSGCLDQVAAAVGAGAREPFCAMDGIGTVECVLPVLKEIPDSRRFYRGGYAVIPYVGDDQYVCCVLSFSGGAANKWFRDRIAPGIGYDALNGAVNTETPTGILLLPHFGGAATPYMDSESKAAMVGITYQTGREEIYQAVLEGISYEMRLNLDEAEKNGVRVERVIATGGGAKSRELLQIKANIYRRPVTALMADEVGAVGTMMLTAVAVHAYENLEQAGNALIAEKETFYPNAAAAERYEIMYQKYRGLYQAVRPLVHNIKEEEQ